MMRAAAAWARVGAAFGAGALSTWFIGDAVLRWREAVLNDDEHLRERVRARIAQQVSHPEAVSVQVEGGVVRVSGRVLAAELDPLLSQLTRVARVHKVYNALSTVEEASALGRPEGGTRGSDPAPAP